MLSGKRIIVLGCSGSGKSTFSGKLHRVTGLPLVHLDNIWWRADRTHVSREEFDRALNRTLEEERWIIDGDYSRTYEVRLKACDTVIFLDFDEGVCLEGIAERVGSTREDIPWVEERLNPELIDLVKSYRQINRPKILELIEKYPDKTVHVFKDRREADAWLESCVQNGCN